MLVLGHVRARLVRDLFFVIFYVALACFGRPNAMYDAMIRSYGPFIYGCKVLGGIDLFVLIGKWIQRVWLGFLSESDWIAWYHIICRVYGETIGGRDFLGRPIFDFPPRVSITAFGRYDIYVYDTYHIIPHGTAALAGLINFRSSTGYGDIHSSTPV